MPPTKRFPWQLAVWVGYALVIMLAFLFLQSPWNFVTTGAVLFKATVFLAVLKRAQTIGKDIEQRAQMQAPPPPQE